MKTIEEYMPEDHKKLNQMIEHIDDNIENERDIDKRLAELKWHLEEHFLTEERAILIEFKDKTHRHYPIASSLLLDHDEMRTLLKQMTENKKERTIANLKEFLNDLKKHRNKEERLLYPELDTELDAKTKQRILKNLAGTDEH